MNRRKILRTAEVSEMTGTPQATLRYYRHLGKGPRSFKLGQRVTYFEEDVLAWIEAQAAATSVGGAA